MRDPLISVPAEDERSVVVFSSELESNADKLVIGVREPWQLTGPPDDVALITEARAEQLAYSLLGLVAGRRAARRAPHL